MVLRIVKSKGLFHMGLGSGELSAQVESLPQRAMGHQEHIGGVAVLGHGKQLLPQLTHGLEFRPIQMKLPQSSQPCWVSPTCRHNSRARL